MNFSLDKNDEGTELESQRSLSNSQILCFVGKNREIVAEWQPLSVWFINKHGGEKARARADETEFEAEILCKVK